MAMDAQAVAGLVVSASERDCPVCGTRDFETVGTRDRSGAPLRTVMCTACGHVFTNPAPTPQELADYYTTKYRAEYKGVTTPKAKHVLRAGFRALERLERLKRFRPAPAAVLDVGAGGGEFAYLLSRSGYTVTGIEPNAGYAGYARATYGVDIRALPLEQVDFPTESFDVITLHHVLEHLSEPREALATFHRWLKPGGLLVVEVPSIMSWFHAPRRRFHAAHLHNFHRFGLEDLMSQSGFAPADTLITEGPAHLNVVARKSTPAVTPARDATRDVRAHLRGHTELTHVVSGWAFKRLLGNLMRPWRERRRLKALGNARGRDILDRLHEESRSP